MEVQVRVPGVARDDEDNHEDDEERRAREVAVGTDDNNLTALEEAENLHRLGVFDNLALLKIWTEDTARSVFPARRIGALRDGYEATFIALDADPLADFTGVRKIGLRFKQGHFIEVEKDAPGRPGSKSEPGKHP